METNVNNTTKPQHDAKLPVMRGAFCWAVTGDPLQSFNFQNKKGATIDNYFISLYVDGTKWQIVDSILDMTLEQQAAMVKTGQTGGIDIFFGNGYNGAVPRLGATILR